MSSRQVAVAVVVALAGLGLEVVYTALAGGDVEAPPARRRFLVGYSSVWYLPIYAVVPFFFAVLPASFRAWPWALRGSAYMLVAWVGEYVAMGLLHLLLGQSPSEESYRKSRWHLHGLTRLDHGPAYFAGALALEWLCRALAV
jgi:hypothetical protein